MQVKHSSIVFVNNSDQLGVGGAGKMMIYVANLATSIFDEVAIFMTTKSSRPESLKEGISFHNVNRPDYSVFHSRLKAICEIRRYVKHYRPGYVCTFVTDVALYSRIATIGLGATVISAERGDPYSLSLPWRILSGLTYRFSDFAIFQLKRAMDFYGKRVRKHSYVIPNAFVPKCDNNPYLGERKRTIVGAGRFVKEKRFDVLVDAFATVLKSHPDYKLIIYGDGELRADYETQVQRLGITESVSFPGYIKNVESVIREDGVFVLSSSYEGIPNVLMEALSTGIPCVSTDCTPGGPYFLTKGGKNGLLVPVDNSDAMADAINRIIENPNFAHALSNQGPEILKDLTNEVISSMWLDVFLQITKRYHA